MTPRTPDLPEGEPSASQPDTRRRGPLAWMAANPVAANLLMGLLLIVGIYKGFQTKQEIFPEFVMPIVVVTVVYPGASPAEVEQGVILAAEEGVREIEGVKRVVSTASEGNGRMFIEFESDADPDRGLNDVKSAIDRIQSFPEDSERPVISLAVNRREVVSLVFYGDADEKVLRAYAEKARDDLLKSDDVTLVSLFGVRPKEISIDVPQDTLRQYGITLDQVADAVRRTSVEIPAGGVKTAQGEVLVRTAERRLRGDEFHDVVVLSRPDGTEVTLDQLATITDGFQETDEEAFYNGERAVMVRAYRIGDQTPDRVAAEVRDYVEQVKPLLPPNVRVAVWADFSEFLSQRFALLFKNAWMGLILVILVLGLFLEFRLAFWVTLGIPISFIGSLVFLPELDASLNMISLFAFIVTLGLVVDDAIVVGEAIHRNRGLGMKRLDAAIAGAREVAFPVTIAILTTIVAFAPMLFVSGPAGKFFRLIPIVVIAVLTISWIESLWILPAHLAHSRGAARKGPFGWLHHQQQRFSQWFERMIETVYVPFLRRCVRLRYATLAICVGTFLFVLAPVVGGYVKSVFLPDIEQDIILADIRLPFGASVEDTKVVTDHLVQSAREVLEANGGEDGISRGIFSQVGNNGSLQGGDGPPGGMNPGSHKAEVAVFLVPEGDRQLRMSDFSTQWREAIGEVPGVESMTFNYTTGPSQGRGIQIELSHDDMPVLEAAATKLAAELSTYAGVVDVDPGFSPGKEQLDFSVTPQASALGITPAFLAQQVRGAFYGVEALRQQRGRDEVRVYVRLPQDERTSEHDIESFTVFTPVGGEIPLSEAADVDRGRSYTDIRRQDGRRTITVEANVDQQTGNATEVVASLKKSIMPKLESEYSGLSYDFAGQQRDQEQMKSDLGLGFLLSLVGIYALLAIAFRSYIQPFIVMSVIPFGIIGAILGHMVLGYSLSMMSMMGVVALSGVVVNDSLILVDAVNRYRRDGVPVFEAIIKGGARRFRPILLTSLTTFFGLMPMLLETSVQARFMIPMAISLGVGVMFATVIMLVLVPAIYRIVADIQWVISAFWGGGKPVDIEEVAPAE
jgi:multidrug efflux pump subunit AcrB